MQSAKTSVSSLWTRVRGARLTSAFTLLAVLTVGILAGSLLTGNVSGKEAQSVDSSDARPLTIPSPVALSNGFSAIVKQVGPAVVNINTESLPKQSSRHGHLQVGPEQQSPNGDDGSDNGGDQGNMQDFFNHFFGGSGPVPGAHTEVFGRIPAT